MAYVFVCFSLIEKGVVGSSSSRRVRVHVGVGKGRGVIANDGWAA